MSKTRKCPNCGAKMPEDMRFCGSCGANMDEESDYIQGLPRPIRRPDEPRPAETAIRPEKRRGAKRNVWQYIVVLAVIAAVIAVAVILVIKMNQPAEIQQASETYDTVHVINADGQEITATAAPEPLEETPEASEAPQETAEVQPTETPVPTEAPQAFDVTETSDTVYVTGSGVNLRSGPGTSYDIVTIAVAGTELERTGTTDNNWSRVRYDGRECFISNAFISTDKPKAADETPKPNAGSPADDTVVITEDANIRTGPGSAYEIIGVAAADTELKRTGTENGWSKVVFNGAEGYVYDGLIKVKGSDELVEKTGTLTVTSEVNLRSGPSTDDEILGVAKVGAELTMTGKIGNWYRIEYDGKTAYVNGNLVRE